VVGEREDGGDTRDAIIPTRAAKAAWPQTKKPRGVLPLLEINPKDDTGRATCSVTDKNLDKTTIKEIVGNFPNVGNSFPDTSNHTLKISLDVNLLAQIAKSYGDSGMTLHLNPSNLIDGYCTSEIIVTSAKENGAVAVLMPLRTNGGYCDLNENLAVKKLNEMKTKPQP